MKKLLALAAVLIGALIAFRGLSGVSAPARRYQAFAEEMLNRRYEAAAAMTDGLSAEDLARAGTQERIGSGPSMFQALFPSKFTLKSQDELPDGSVRLEAVQTVLFNPIGVESAARPAMYAKMNQVVTLRKSNGGWKIISFENTFDSMDSLRRR